ncbi:MAG TPA: hypothetical protein VGH73_23385 [Thermoanaerobaculia bacterium]|jgi:hypothetical protein
MQAQEVLVTEIDIKEAVRRAKDFAVMLFAPEKISGLGLEAVERSEDGRYWLVTLGFTRPHLQPKRTSSYSPIEQILPRPEPQIAREYKVFRVDAQSGEVVAVKRFEE